MQVLHSLQINKIVTTLDRFRQITNNSTETKKEITSL